MLDHIQAVIFDLYGTLIHIHTDEADIPGLWKPLCYFYAYYGAQYTPETLMADYRALVEREEQAARQRSGVAAAEINLERVFAALFTRRGVEVSPEVVRCVGQMFRANSTRVAELYPGAKALLEDLRAAGKTVCLLSNAQRVFTEYEMKMLDIYDSFDHLRISSDYDFKKPSAAYYQCLLQELPMPVEQILVVGNSPEDDMAPAAALGLHTCLLNTDHVTPPPCCEVVLDGADYPTLRKLLGLRASS